MDPLSFAIAIGPLAAYTLLMGLIAARRQPLVVSGDNDLVTLSMALTGIALVGPLSLFRPEAATAELGAWVWLFLLSLYWLTVILAVLLCRPRLVVYSATAEQVRSALAEIAPQLDSSARWAGDSLCLPAVGVQLHVDSLRWFGATTLAANGVNQATAGWRRLGKALDRTLRQSPAAKPAAGPWLLGAGIGGLLAVAWRLAASPDEVMVAWRRFFEI